MVEEWVHKPFFEKDYMLNRFSTTSKEGRELFQVNNAADNKKKITKIKKPRHHLGKRFSKTNFLTSRPRDNEAIDRIQAKDLVHGIMVDDKEKKQHLEVLSYNLISGKPIKSSPQEESKDMKKELMLDFLVSKCREDDEWEKRFKPQFVHFDHTSDAQKLREIKKKKREIKRKKEYESKRKMHAVKKKPSQCSLESIISDEYALSIPLQPKQAVPNNSTLVARMPQQNELHKYIMYEQIPNMWQQPPPSSEPLSTQTPPSSQQSVPPAPPLPPFPLTDSSGHNNDSSSFSSKIRSVKPQLQNHRMNDFDHMNSHETTPNLDLAQVYNTYGAFDKNFSLNNSNSISHNNAYENIYQKNSNFTETNSFTNLANTITNRDLEFSDIHNKPTILFVSGILTEKEKNNNPIDSNINKKQKKVFNEIKSLRIFNLLKLPKIKSIIESLASTITRTETTKVCGNFSNSSSNFISSKPCSTDSIGTDDLRTGVDIFSLTKETTSRREDTTEESMTDDHPVDIFNNEKVLNQFSIVKIKNKNDEENNFLYSSKEKEKHSKNKDKQEKSNKKTKENTVDEKKSSNYASKPRDRSSSESNKKSKKKKTKNNSEEKRKHEKTEKPQTDTQPADKDSLEDSEEKKEMERLRRAKKIKNSKFEKARTFFTFANVEWNKEKVRTVNSATTNDLASHSRSSSDLTSLWSEEKVENPLKIRTPRRKHSFNQTFSRTSSYETNLESVEKIDVEAIKSAITRETIQTYDPIIATKLEVKESSSHETKDEKKKKHKSSKRQKSNDQTPVQLKTSFANKAEVLISDEVNANTTELNEDDKLSTRSSNKAEIMSNASSKKRIELFVDNPLAEGASKVIEFSSKSDNSEKSSSTESSGYPETRIIKNLAFKNAKRSKVEDETLIQQRRSTMSQEKEFREPKKFKKLPKLNVKKTKNKKEPKSSKEKKEKVDKTVNAKVKKEKRSVYQ